jgi:hypothetical protein
VLRINRSENVGERDYPPRTTGASFIDVLDRVLDMGVVVDAGMRVSLAGIDLITVDAHVVIASFDTYLTRARHSSRFDGASRNRIGQPSDTGSGRR